MSLTSQQVGSLFVAQALAEAGNTYDQYQTIKAESRYQKDIYDVDARLANLDAEEAIRRGDREAAKIERQTRSLIGSQRASYAAQGVAVDSGTPAAVQAETEVFGAYDAVTAKNNAIREAFGFKSQALDYQTRGRMAEVAGKYGARRTLVTGALRTATYGTLSYSAFNRGKFVPRNPTAAKFNEDYLKSRNR